MNKDFVRAEEQGSRGSIVAHQLLLAAFDSYLKLFLKLLIWFQDPVLSRWFFSGTVNNCTHTS